MTVGLTEQQRTVLSSCSVKLYNRGFQQLFSMMQTAVCDQVD